MRAEEDRLARCVASRPRGDDVPGGVDRRRELRVAHQAEHVLARLPVGVAVGESRDAALRIRAEARELREMPVRAGRR